VGRVDYNNFVLPNASTPSTFGDNIGLMTMIIHDLDCDISFEDLSDLNFVLKDYYWHDQDL
jgi:hypothetical protein